MKKFYAILLLLSTTVLLGAEGDRIIRNPNQDKDIKIQVNRGGSDVDSITVDGATGVVAFPQGASGVGSGSAINLIDNADAETSLNNVTASGGTFTRETGATRLNGNGSFSWDSNALGQTLTWDAKTVPVRLEGNTCYSEGYYEYGGSSGDIVLRVELDDGTTPLTADLDLINTNGQVAMWVIRYNCPENDSIQLQMETTVADAGLIVIDDVHNGSDLGRVVGGQGDVIAEAFYPSTPNCNWPRTSATTGQFDIDADCPAITVNYDKLGLIDTTNDNRPTLVLTNAPAGKYVVQAMGSIDMSTTSSVLVALSDGTSTKNGQACGGGSTTDGCPVSLTGVFSYNAPGTRTFEIYGNSSAGGTVSLQNSPEDKVTSFVVTYYPPSVDTIPLEASKGYIVDANIGGASLTLGSGAISDYANGQIGNASLTLVRNRGTPNIPCSGGNPATGTTCSAGNELIGVSFKPPYTGIFRACASFAASPNGGSGATTFALVEFEPATTNIIQIGSDKVPMNSGTEYRPFHVCGNFEFTDTTEKQIILSREQTSWTSAEPQIIADQSAAIGNREISIVVFPLTQNLPQRVALPNDVVQANGEVGLGIYGVSVDVNDAGNSIVGFTQKGNWVDSVTRDGEGNYTINVPSGIFTSLPVCTGMGQSQHEPGGVQVLYNLSASTTTTIDIITTNQTAAVDEDWHVLCFGE